ncbi:hypothetical protein CW745_10750 [Psychromonas sp. psych-6C06]|uniref:type IV pilus modification PilV family protein n=1 Tax=Psychromonas sp. psych-6C06 TaxID=2058089 RepID=UPI000C333A46|nr:prepilin-type N-terminal cleavage/methylation domain-containing protein [Psychromonas sp. psych-6C06]PKF61785.1 hypothetical protein CW745_10750 [Psychromonas sp. psych-6C06]
MKSFSFKLGFSLVEILVSLFVVSLAAVNISGLQKMVGDQNRNNFAHTAVVELVSEKLEEVMQFDDMNDVLNLHNTNETYQDRGTTFHLLWHINSVSGASMTSPIREVSIDVSWPDATGATQTFNYAEQISFAMLLEGAGGTAGTNDFPYTISNLLGTDQVGYFESKMGYKKSAYVIYNSQLFQATAVHSVGNGHQRDVTPPMSSDGEVSEGWEHLGRIDDPDLSDLFTD